MTTINIIRLLVLISLISVGSFLLGYNYCNKVIKSIASKVCDSNQMLYIFGDIRYSEGYQKIINKSTENKKDES